MNDTLDIELKYKLTINERNKLDMFIDPYDLEQVDYDSKDLYYRLEYFRQDYFKSKGQPKYLTDSETAKYIKTLKNKIDKAKEYFLSNIRRLSLRAYKVQSRTEARYKDGMNNHYIQSHYGGISQHVVLDRIEHNLDDSKYLLDLWLEDFNKIKLTHAPKDDWIRSLAGQIYLMLVDLKDVFDEDNQPDVIPSVDANEQGIFVSILAIVAKKKTNAVKDVAKEAIEYWNHVFESRQITS